jgi:hypothetical protein
MNGPRRAFMDATAELRDGGRVTSAEGIAMHTVADVHVPGLRVFLSAQRPSHTQFTVVRTPQWLFPKGSDIHEPVSPEGHQYAMQSVSRHVDPDLDVEQLPALGERLQLPDGRRYRVRTLDEDLRMGAHGDAHIAFDEHENNYRRHA